MSFLLALAPLPPEAYWASGAAAAAALLFVARRATRRRPPPPLLERVTGADTGPSVADIDRVLNWLPHDPGADDRRKSPRRSGPPTPVGIARVAGGKADDGAVLDRSTGGLCLASDRAYPDGTTLYVRPAGAADDCPWVAVVVRHCRGCRDYYLIGVEFAAPLPWGVLLQFG